MSMQNFAHISGVFIATAPRPAAAPRLIPRSLEGADVFAIFQLRLELLFWQLFRLTLMEKAIYKADQT